MSRDATKSSNGFFYQRLYFLSVILDKLSNNDDELKKINCIEENNIDGNEYEDFTFLHNNKITTYQIKYKNINSKNSSESITKDCGFLKTFIPYFDNKYDGYDIENIYYIVSKKENGDSNFFKIFNYTDEIIYKYLILLATENKIKGTYEENIISAKYDEIKNNIDIKYDNNLLTNKNNKDEDKKNIVFEKFKKIMKENDENTVIQHIKKYKILDGYTYLELIKKINSQIKGLLSDKIKYDDINNDVMIINYIRYKIYDELTENSFRKNELLKLNKIKEIINKFQEDNKSKTKGELFNKLFLDLINEYNGNDDMTNEILNLFKEIENDLSYLKKINIDDNFLNVLHDEYKKNKNDNIKNLYNKIKHIFCIQMCYKLHMDRNTKYKYNDYSDFLSSLNTYSHHNVDTKIITKKSHSDIIKQFTNKKITKIKCKKCKKKLDEKYFDKNKNVYNDICTNCNPSKK
jgi:hypothetical protein